MLVDELRCAILAHTGHRFDQQPHFVSEIDEGTGQAKNVGVAARAGDGTRDKPVDDQRRSLVPIWVRVCRGSNLLQRLTKLFRGGLRAIAVQGLLPGRFPDAPAQIRFLDQPRQGIAPRGGVAGEKACLTVLDSELEGVYAAGHDRPTYQRRFHPLDFAFGAAVRVPLLQQREDDIHGSDGRRQFAPRQQGQALHPLAKNVEFRRQSQRASHVQIHERVADHDLVESAGRLQEIFVMGGRATEVADDEAIIVRRAAPDGFIGETDHLCAGGVTHHVGRRHTAATDATGQIVCRREHGIALLHRSPVASGALHVKVTFRGRHAVQGVHATGQMRLKDEVVYVVEHQLAGTVSSGDERADGVIVGHTVQDHQIVRQCFLGRPTGKIIGHGTLDAEQLQLLRVVVTAVPICATMFATGEEENRSGQGFAHGH